MTIPEWKALRKKCKQQQIKLQDENYFEIADEFVTLQVSFIPDSIIDTVSLWVDMIIYPIYVFVQLCMQNFSIMHVVSLVKTYQLWISWLRFQELGKVVKEWTRVVKSLDGPWISSNNPEYHVFVYADSMQRISHALKLKKKVLNKCLQKDHRP